ncbi:MAG: inositol 2-dehydrogenase [Oscillospiraceae bacterium]|nr:inositol 2-dehydrogenase [Oscillospiraceae bacterium]
MQILPGTITGRPVRVGSVGLGRLGVLHAENIAMRIPGAILSALCDLDRTRLEHTAAALGAERTFTDFAEMAAWDGIDAVCIVSPSALHTKHIRIAMEHGKHVFCEKPLGVTLEQCKDAEQVVGAHPELIFMLGFMRRYDPSYIYAKQKLDAGEIGRVVLLRSYSQDPDHQIKGALAFAPHSGGQFLDMAVHDIDLARWFIGREPEKVWAIGGCYAHPEFAQHGDGDNVSCLMKFEDDAMCFLLAGRTSPHGYNVETEIMGTKGTLRIASVPQKNLVEILDEHGVRKECSQTFHERFGEAFLGEMREFISCIRQGRRPEVSVSDGTRVLEIATQCKASFETGELVCCK